MHLSSQGRLAGILLLALLVNASVAAESIEGVWITADGDGLVEFRFQDERLVGFISGTLSDPDNSEPSRFDDLNPDPALRSRALLGLEIFAKLAPAGENKWKGEVYDPDSGKTYQCKIELIDDDTLKLRGFIGFSLLGRTETWVRK